MNYYISDLHLGHFNMIRIDNRPFTTVQEMDEHLIDNWNSTVSNTDTVYIIGDFIWSGQQHWERYLKQLHGKKVLIRGNHDPKQFEPDVRRHFQMISDYLEIKDGDIRVILCHYPIPFYRSDYNDNVWMLCGHVHNSKENTLLQGIISSVLAVENGPKCHIVNVGCMMPYMDYKPRTLEELMAAWKKKYHG